MSKARGLFDEQIRLEKLSKKQDPLERLSSHIDFEFFVQRWKNFSRSRQTFQKEAAHLMIMC